MNTLFKRNNDIELDYTEIERVAESLGLNIRLVELLFLRGMTDEEKITNFLQPKVESLCDPFLMKGIRKAAERIDLAIKNNERIAIYGDYDVDGISAAAILSLFLSNKGVMVAVHIPSRFNDGYGLKTQSIESIIEKFNPDLLITCDCGISCAEEVEYCLDLGVDVIVTDHHEPGNDLPKCIVVNPKQPADTYPDKNLSGAGVAYKLVQALSKNNEHLEFLDLVAIATIADLVPMLNENRLLVQLGLEKINEGHANKGLLKLLDSIGINGEVVSDDIAFKVAPRLNSSGRVGDAYRAFELLTSKSDKEIDCIIKEIEKCNDSRRELCDKLYAEATPYIEKLDFINSRAIILVHEKWEKGITGIAAAKFAAEYNRPTFIIVDKDENGILKGTARGINGVNIYNVLHHCRECLCDYGGHSGAAGFSIHCSQIEAFKESVNGYLKTLSSELFLPVSYYDLEVQPRELTVELFDAFTKLEPTGNSNKKPLLKLDVVSPHVSPCKNPAHTQIAFDNVFAYAYNNIKKNQFLQGSDTKTLVLELSDKKGESIYAHVKQISPQKLYINDKISSAVYVYYNLFLGIGENNDPNYISYEENELSSIIGDKDFGTLIISAGRQSAEIAEKELEGRMFIRSFLSRPEKNNYSSLVVSPVFVDFSFHGFEKIIFTDGAYENLLRYVSNKSKAKIYVPKDNDFIKMLSGISFEREIFSDYFKLLKQYANIIEENFAHTISNLSPLVGTCNMVQLAVCMNVFYDLGFIYFEDNKLQFDSKVRRQLSESALYRKLLRR